MRKLILTLCTIIASTIFAGSFADKSVSFRQFNDIGGVAITEGIGEIINNSGKSYESAKFEFNIYDANNKIIGTETFRIRNFTKGQIRSFKEDFMGIYVRDIKSYRVDFSDGY